MSPERDVKRVLIYARQSQTEAGDEAGSLSDQEAYCRDWAARFGVEVVDVVADPNTPGPTPPFERDAAPRAIAAVEQGHADAVVVSTLDRFSRTLDGALPVFRALEDAGGALIALDLPAQGGAPEDGKLVRNLLLSIAEWQWSRTRRLTITGKQRAVSRDHRYPGQAPLGYTRDPVTRKLVPGPDAAKVVEAFELAASEGFAAAAEYLSRATGRELFPSHVKRMLSNRAYIGELRHGDTRVERIRGYKQGRRIFALPEGDPPAGAQVRWFKVKREAEATVIPGAHEPLVDRALFARVNGPDAQPMDRAPSVSFPFSRRPAVVCAQCHEQLVGTRTGSRLSRSYRCRTHGGTRDPEVRAKRHPFARIDATRLELIVRDQLSGLYGPWAEAIRADAWNPEELLRPAPDDGPEREALDAAVRELEAIERLDLPAAAKRAAVAAQEEVVREAQARLDAKQPAAEDALDLDFASMLIEELPRAMQALGLRATVSPERGPVDQRVTLDRPEHRA